MKKYKLMLLPALAALSAFAYTPAYANEWCDRYGGEDYIHCAYIKGLNAEDMKDGRFIKLYDPTHLYSFTYCHNTSSAFTFPQGTGEYLQSEGTLTAQYSICTDGTGNQCEPIGTDTFTVAKNSDGKYFGEPRDYAIDVSAVKDKYPQCQFPAAERGVKMPALR